MLWVAEDRYECIILILCFNEYFSFKQLSYSKTFSVVIIGG